MKKFLSSLSLSSFIYIYITYFIRQRNQINNYAEQSRQNGPSVTFARLGSLVSRQADDVNMPRVKLPVGTKLTFRSGPHEQRSLLNAFALENYSRHLLGRQINEGKELC